jgi:phosphodiesterase/alkaline phosphatase D-like protein
MTDSKDDLLKAVELALADDWEAAHQLVQQYESDATAAWIHAVLHKIEGDEANSRYWYRLAGRLKHFEDEPREELTAIQAELKKRPQE